MISGSSALGGALRPMLPFFAGLALALGLAVAAPEVGASGGMLHAESLVPWALGLIFFIQGLQLPVEEVRRGLGAWKVHVFCQVWMFGVYPVLGLLLVSILGGRISEAERAGLLFLCVLPTTIATSAAFSGRVGGNTAAVLANIVLSNGLGVLIAPMALTWILARHSSGAVALGQVVEALVVQLLLPFMAGQLARLWLAGWAARRRGWLREAGSILIFFIIYAAVCNYLSGPQGAASPGFWLLGAVLVLLGAGKGLCWSALRLAGWPHDLQVAAFYAASQKTLAAGLPMAGAVLAALGPEAADVPLAVLALPLIVFHISQLVVGALLIPMLARRTEG